MLRSLINADLNKVKNHALKIISKRQYSVKQLQVKLLSAGCSSEVAEEVINYLRHLNYLDDKKFAEIYVTCSIKTKKYSRFRIKSELYKRGISEGIIESVLANSFPDDSIESDMIKKIIEKYISKSSFKKTPEEKKKDKLLRFLAGKKYEMDIVFPVVEQVFSKKY